MNHILPSDFLPSALNLIVDAALKSLALLLAAGIAAALLKSKSAAVRHRVWCLGFGSLILLPVLSVTLPRWNLAVLPAAETPHVVVNPAPAPATADESISFSGAHSVALDRMSGTTSVHHEPIAQTTSAALDATSSTGQQANSESRDASSSYKALLFRSTIVAIWIAGALLLLIPLLVGSAAARWLFFRCRPVRDGQWTALLAELRNRLQLRRSVRLLETEQAIIPVTWGVLRPVVLIPEMSRDWSGEKRRSVLLHELAHVKRFDVLLQIVARLACSLYWFNPLAWYALHRLRIERELACDDCVVAAGEKAVDYADQLVEIARGYRVIPITVGVAMAKPSGLEQRIVALLDRARAHGPISRRLAGALALATTVVLITVAVLKPVARAASGDQSNKAIITETAPDRTSVASASQDKTAVPSVNANAAPGAHVIRGRVEDPQGNPLSGARVWLQRYLAGALLDERLRREEKPSTDVAWSEWIAVSQTDNQGAFRIDVDASRFRERAKQNSIIPLRLAATADGFGFGVTQFQGVDFHEGAITIVPIRMAKDLPIEGRLVTADGKPSAGAAVQLLWILPPDKPPLDEYIRAIHAGQKYSTGPGEPIPVPGQPKVGVVDPHGHQPDALTDRDGRFTIRGVGAERIGRMMVWGPAIKLCTIDVATRPAPGGNPQSDAANAFHLAGPPDKSASPGGGFAASRAGFGNWRDAPDLSEYYARFTHVSDPIRVLRGVIRDRDTKHPVAGATIRANGYPATTDVEGRFEIANCPKQDRYAIDVPTTSGQYLNITLPVADTPGIGPLEFDVDLPKGITARGRVTDQQTGEPLEGSVEYEPLFPNPYLDRYGLNRNAGIGLIPRSSGPVGKDGRYELQVLPGPGVILFRDKDFYTAQWPRHEIYASPPIDMKRLNEVLGGAAANGAVNNRATSGAVNNEEQLCVAGESGFWTLGRHGHKALALIRPQEGTSSIMQDLKPVRGHDLQGVLLDPDGTPAREVWASGLFIEPIRLWHIDNGKFTVNCVPPDESRFVLFRRNSLAAALEIPKGATGPLTVRLGPSATVVGRIVDATGRPVYKAKVEIGPLKQASMGAFQIIVPRNGLSDADGQYSISNLVPGIEFSIVVNGKPAESVKLKPGRHDAGTIRLTSQAD